MLDGLSMSEDEKSNAKMEDGEIRDKDDSSDSSWKTGWAKSNGSSRSRISNEKSHKLKNYFKQLFSATLSNVSNKIKLKTKTYASQQAKLTGCLKAEGDCILHGEKCGHTSHNCRTDKRLAKKTKDSWGKEKPKKKEEFHTMLAESLAMAMKNKTKKKKESSKEKVEFEKF